MAVSTYSIPASDELKDSRHAAVGAWFFGPRAENFDHLQRSFSKIIDQQKITRETTYPDSDFITDEMRQADLYIKAIKDLDEGLDWVSEILSKTSVPFWSPRYNAHMSMESSMPAVIGYLAGLLHNQNNVATEASAYTTFLETQVGKGLSYMLGYNIQLDNPADKGNPITIRGFPLPAREEDDPYDDEPEENIPIGWGHITCGGSVANLESIWAARNLKFYPLSLKLAIEKPGSILAFLTDRFRVQTCDGNIKLFIECTTWELLNLKPSTTLNLPKILYDEFGVSQNILTKVLPEFSIQSVGKDYLEKIFKIEQPPLLLVGTTKHYSWPKGAAIAGIGRTQVVNVDVDNKARMDPADLEAKLNDALAKKRAIYAVVAIIGSTEHGAVDPLVAVLKLRQKFEKKGISFVVHCDGAWGGYFASTIRDFDVLNTEEQISGLESRVDGWVPTMALTSYTKKQLGWLGRADSITIDPHKSGYCPYPAGGLCYRDGRMRYLVTWTSPVVFRGENESIGVYGVEGSKPGASAVGAWLSHKVIGLDKNGYGMLLGEAIFTCARLYCHWATMEPKEISYRGKKARIRVTPFTMLPAEDDGRGTPEQIEEQKQFIRDHIIGKGNRYIYECVKARELISKLGGDLQINTFAVNFEIDGVLNDDVIEANYLNNRIFARTSFTDWRGRWGKKTLQDVKLFLTSTIFAQSDYKTCLNTYKKRLGVKGPQDLYTLINITMTPWATSSDFVDLMAKAFQDIENEELRYSVLRNTQYADTHGFIIQGIKGDRVCGVHIPMFNMQNHRWQLIISCKLPPDVLEKVRKLKAKNPTTFYTFANIAEDILENLVKPGGSFEARIDEQFPFGDPTPDSIAKCEISDIQILYKRSLESKFLSTDYPENMLLYVYSAQRGTDEKPIFHVDHLLNVAVDIQLNSDSVKFDVEEIPQEEAEKMVKKHGAWFRLSHVHERVLQPLLQKGSDEKTEYNVPGLRWMPGATFRFSALSAEHGLPKDDDLPMFTDVHIDKHDHAAGAEGVFRPANSFSMLGLQQANASGLVAEYPNPLQMPELRLRNQTTKMQMFKAAILADAPKSVVWSPLGEPLRV